ncbi:putative reverse transcriptase domain-containing protein [Tanacetum coccineum]
MPPRRLKKKSVKRLVENVWLKLLRNTKRLGPIWIMPEVQEETLRMLGELRWIEKVEQVFEICKCAEEDKVMFAASTFEGRALTWWNENLLKSNDGASLTLKGDDIEAYNNRFHELALMCPDLVPNEKKKFERYIRGFPKNIKGNVTSSKPTTLHEAINMASELVEQAVQGKAARVSKSNKRKCKAHHQPGPCPPRCSNCHKLGHEEEDCRTRIPVARGNSLQNVTCFGCGEKGHYRDKCPRGRNPQNEGARGGAYVMRTEEPQQDPNVIAGTS